MAKLGHQYQDVIFKIKEQLFKDTNKYTCKKCYTIMEEDDSNILAICPKCFNSIYIKKEK
jgi:hypothetical protein